MATYVFDMRQTAHGFEGVLTLDIDATAREVELSAIQVTARGPAAHQLAVGKGLVAIGREFAAAMGLTVRADFATDLMRRMASQAEWDAIAPIRP